MNERMKALLAQITAIQAIAKGFMTGETKEVEKASAELAKADALQKEFNVEKALYEADKCGVPDIIPPTEKTLTDEQKEEKAFVNHITGVEKTLSQGANGAIVPKSISNKIIETVKELSPIYARATVYNATGELAIPSYGADGGSDVNAAYQGAEFTELTAAQGKFTSISLLNNAVGSLALISKQLINNTDIDVATFTKNKVAKAFADFIEKESIVGTGATGHMTGVTLTTNLNTLLTKTLAGITADVLIDTQLLVPEVYQANACWLMNKTTFAALRKLKDGDNTYLLTKDFTTSFGWTLLGKPVFISENMPSVAASTVPIIYGDLSGLAIKLSKNVEIQVLVEKYATQNAIGIVGWAELDSKIENSQKFVGLKMSV